MASYSIEVIGIIHSELKKREDAPKQGHEGGINVRLEIFSGFKKGLKGIKPGDELWLLTWLHQSNRNVLEVYPRGNTDNPLTGVFATRSPNRPNPIGLHKVQVLEIEGTNLIAGPLEAIDGTPIIDIKPVI